VNCIAASCRRRTHGQQAWEDSLPENGIGVGEQRTWEPGGQSLCCRDSDGHLIEMATPDEWANYRNSLAPAVVRSAREHDTP